MCNIGSTQLDITLQKEKGGSTNYRFSVSIYHALGPFTTIYSEIHD
jgi:hypothetical protein